jgi:hypothetical protein
MLLKFKKVYKKIICNFGKTNLKIIKNGGLIPLKDFITGTGLINKIEDEAKDKRNQLRIKYTLGEIVLGLILKILTGEKRLFDYRFGLDKYIFEEIYTPGKEPHRNTFRYFLLRNCCFHKIFSKILFWLGISDIEQKVKEKKLNRITLDVDQFAKVVYGHQEGACRGYSAVPSRKKLFQIVVWSIRELNILLRLELKSGNCHSSNNFFNVLKPMVMKLKELALEIVVVADSGYENKRIMNFLDENGIKFIFSEKQRKTVKRRGKYAKNKIPYYFDGYQIKERKFFIKGRENKPLREIFVRASELRDENGQYYFSEFESDEFTNIFVTNLEWANFDIYEYYKGHAAVEKHIEELKNDFNLGISHNEKMDYNQFFTQIIGIAYNIKSLFLSSLGNLIKEKGYIKLSTLQKEVISIPAILVNSGNKKTIKFSENGYYKIKDVFMQFGYRTA